MTRILGIAAGLAVLIVGASWLYLDVTAGWAIESAASSALGVPTRVNSVRIGLLSGELGLGGLEVSNPAGFQSPHFLTLREGRVVLAVESLLEDEIRVPLLRLDGVELDLERGLSGANFGVILEALERFEAASGEGQVEAGSEIRLVIEELVISDVKARARLLPGLGSAAEVEVSIPELRLQNVGSESDGGVLVSELTGTVLKAILQAVVGRRGQLPAEFAGELRAGLNRLTSVPIRLSGGLTEIERDARGKAKEALGKATERIDEQARETLGRLRGLIPRRGEE